MPGNEAAPRRDADFSLDAPAREAKAMLVGLGVRCAGGERLGRIKSVHMDEGRGDISHVVVSLGSFSRVGEDCRAVPSDCLAFGVADDCVDMRVSVETLLSAPIYVGERRWADAGWRARVAAHFAGRR